MNSIRRQLTIQLLGGLAVIWIGAGAAVYFAVQSALLKTLDAELAADSRIMRFVGRDGGETTEGGRPRGRGLISRHPAFYETNGTSFYQIWAEDGSTLRRSPSLGAMDLPFPLAERGTFASAKLADGREIRTLHYRPLRGGKTRSRKKGPAVESRDDRTIVVAKEMTHVEENLVRLLGGIAIIGLVVGVGTVLLVGGSLVRGLRPLDSLGEQSRDLDITADGAGFNASNAPAELQPVYARLNDLITRIQQSFERERRFSSDLAHEMRTPIAELKMMNEIALKYEDQAGEKTHLESLDIAKSLEAMVTNLLALARWENGEIELKEESIDLESFVAECWRPFAPTAERRGLSTEFEFVGSPRVKSDPDMLRHVIGNLLANAAEYCPEQEIVSVRVDERRFELSNPAPQLTAEDVEKLCDRYWRGDSARSGTNHAGLGLALAQGCCQALGVEFQISKQGDNIAFTLQFDERA